VSPSPAGDTSTWWELEKADAGQYILSGVKAGFLDTFRQFETAGGHYTWWSPMRGARARNVGWRIDYFLISASLRPRLKRAFIHPHIPGSDHCPVGIELE
jgi:exodeoxyribonuclease-3